MTEEQLRAEIRRLQAQLANRPPYWTPTRIARMRRTFLLETEPPPCIARQTQVRCRPPATHDDMVVAAVWVSSSGQLTAGRSPQDAWRRALEQAIDHWAERVAADLDAGPESAPVSDLGCRAVQAGSPVELRGRYGSVLVLLDAHGFENGGRGLL